MSDFYNVVLCLVKELSSYDKRNSDRGSQPPFFHNALASLIVYCSLCNSGREDRDCYAVIRSKPPAITLNTLNQKANTVYTVGRWDL
jgi:hypothetical protein